MLIHLSQTAWRGCEKLATTVHRVGSLESTVRQGSNSLVRTSYSRLTVT